MDKQAAYEQLVEKRKQFQFAEGLVNPAHIQNGDYDREHLGPWCVWQGNLDARILLIGQDWGSVGYFLENLGMDADDNPTCRNVIELFRTLGIEVGSPSAPVRSAPTFFTNAILGIRDGQRLTGGVRQSWARESTEAFLVPLMQIVEPDIVITLGKVAY